MRTIRALVTAALTAAGMAAAAAAAPLSASAAQPFQHQATGGVYYVEGGGANFVDFSAFDYGNSVAKGAVHYTNFAQADPGSGVWAFAPGPITVSIYYTTDPAKTVLATHIWTITSVVPRAVDAFAFTATGTGGASPELVTGIVDGTGISFSSLYVGGAMPGYTWTSSTGAIDTSNGAIAGTATSALAEPLGWYTDSHAAREVYNFSAKVTSAVFDGANVVFGYTVPLTEAINPGLPLWISATDGASLGVPDTFGYGFSAGTVTEHPFAGGNVVMHK
jgi:hypothetical protein